MATCDAPRSILNYTSCQGHVNLHTPQCLGITSKNFRTFLGARPVKFVRRMYNYPLKRTNPAPCVGGRVRGVIMAMGTTWNHSMCRRFRYAGQVQCQPNYGSIGGRQGIKTVARMTGDARNTVRRFQRDIPHKGRLGRAWRAMEANLEDIRKLIYD